MSRNQLQCPNCGSYATSPMKSARNVGAKVLGYIGEVILTSFRLAMMSPEEMRKESQRQHTDTIPVDVDQNASWDDLSKIKAFKAGQIGAYCRICNFKFDVSSLARVAQSSLSHADQTTSKTRSVEDRLKEAERLLANGTITEEEYKKQRSDILKDL